MTEKMEMKVLSAFVLGLFFGYLIGAFSAADFNIANWNPLFRMCVALIGTLAAVLCAFIVVDTHTLGGETK
jgi:F0F1-type ATP synthase assembly protein I